MNPFAKKAPSESEVTTVVRAAVAENAQADSIVDDVPAVEVIESTPDSSEGDTDERITGVAKLSKLIDDDFPFDESQLDAIEGMSQEPYACLTGAAGTGKTTTTKKLVDTLLESQDFASVNMETYWKKGVAAEGDEEYEAPEKWVPSIAMCAFTGRATQMIKKNFPRDWHGNIMTIHRMLGFFPEFYEEWDDENGGYRKKMRFSPTYNADFKMPWDIVIIDEAGMLGIDLWLQLIAACKPDCRIFMIGDINQLPPVHGKSIFGFAMSNWPAWELTHVHRQQGVNNPIVDNAWRILNGRMPESEGRFQMIEIKGDATYASRQVRAMAPKLKERGVYDPIRDSIITPINGEEGSRGYALGQLPLNREFALIFNPQTEHTRFIIDGGRERKQFAVGDKVMATKNDWETGITNGMTGVITSIEPNGEYAGDHRLFGPVEQVNEYLRANEDVQESIEFNLADLEESMIAIDRGMEKGKEKRDRGPASHIVTVRFGHKETGIEVPFGTLSEVGSLMTAYVVTCHKMQGGEAPTVVIICHDSHRAMLYREWLYTAVTRASEKCILLYSPTALKSALNKQKMPGKTLKEKVLAFNAAQNISIDGVSMARDVGLPESTSTRNKILERADVAIVTPARLTTQAERTGGLASLMRKQQKVQPKSEPEVTMRVKVIVEEVTRTRRAEERQVESPPVPIDGGDLTPKQENAKDKIERLKHEFFDSEGRLPTQQELGALIVGPSPLVLPAPAPKPVAISLPWAPWMLNRIEDSMATKLLTHEKPKPKNPFARRG